MIYIALVSVVLSFAMAIFYQFLGESAQTRDRSDVEEEANFVMRKIDWAMAGVQSVGQPTGGATSTALSVSKYNFSQNPLVFDAGGGAVRLSRGGGEAVPLTSGRVRVDQLVFRDLPAANSQPEGVTMLLGLSSTDISRPVSSTTVSSTIYIFQ